MNYDKELTPLNHMAHGCLQRDLARRAGLPADSGVSVPHWLSMNDETKQEAVSLAMAFFDGLGVATRGVLPMDKFFAEIASSDSFLSWEARERLAHEHLESIEREANAT